MNRVNEMLLRLKGRFQVLVECNAQVPGCSLKFEPSLTSFDEMLIGTGRNDCTIKTGV
jgi:hypothetical protein